MDDNFLVSRIPIRIINNLFKAYKIYDLNIQKELRNNVINQYPENESIDPASFEQKLLLEIVNYHRQSSR
jgi:hypothetical protein